MYDFKKKRKGEVFFDFKYKPSDFERTTYHLCDKTVLCLLKQM